MTRSPASATVLVVMGVSGCGKTTIGTLLSQQLGWDFGEGDALHPQENVDKMASGHPLTDADRWPWLVRVHDWMREHLDAGRSGVITCSALKRAYRDMLRVRPDDPQVVFVHLMGSRGLLLHRLQARRGHYMPASLLDSQLADLEPPGPDERAITVDVEAPPAFQVRHIVDRLGL